MSESLGLEDSQGGPHWDPASFKEICHWASTRIAVKWVRDPCLAHQGIRIYGFFKLVSKVYKLLSLSMGSICNPKLQRQTTDDEWLLHTREGGGRGHCGMDFF